LCGGGLSPAARLRRTFGFAGFARMYPLVPEEMLDACIQMACYFVTMVGAMVGWLMTGRMA
jgi:hypothetical protein